MFELRNVSVGYDGVCVVRDVSFTAQDGQITTLVGTNGCGKNDAAQSDGEAASAAGRSDSAGGGVNFTATTARSLPVQRSLCPRCATYPK